MRWMYWILPVMLLTGCQESAKAPATGIVQAESKGDGKQMNEALIAAAERGDTAELRRLLKAGADKNTKDPQGRTPMMAATYANKPEAVKLLLEAGADVNERDNRLNNPFLYAGAEGLLDILKLTIEAGADPKLTNRYGGTALIPAAERAHLDVIRELLTRTKVDVNHVNNLGWTALMEAVVLGSGGEKHQQAVRLLVEHGADVNIPDKDGVTALAHAKQRGFGEIEQILRKAGAR
ncbi:ankyrin repeat domain-containing protein [Paenibacillus ehimensis]